MGFTQTRYRYDAWGLITEVTGQAKRLTVNDEKTGRYTGHELMAFANLGQWNGRIFDYDIGAFPQADVFIQGRSIAALNRYALGQNNNPNVTDPSGNVFMPSSAPNRLLLMIPDYENQGREFEFSWLNRSILGQRVTEFTFTGYGPFPNDLIRYYFENSVSLMNTRKLNISSLKLQGQEALPNPATLTAHELVGTPFQNSINFQSRESNVSGLSSHLQQEMRNLGLASARMENQRARELANRNARRELIKEIIAFDEQWASTTVLLLSINLHHSDFANALPNNLRIQDPLVSATLKPLMEDVEHAARMNDFIVSVHSFIGVGENRVANVVLRRPIAAHALGALRGAR